MFAPQGANPCITASIPAVNEKREDHLVLSFLILWKRSASGLLWGQRRREMVKRNRVESQSLSARREALCSWATVAQGESQAKAGLLSPGVIAR